MRDPGHLSHALDKQPEPREDPPVVIADRALEAHRLRLRGLDWPTIAQRVGYANGHIAAMAVNAYLHKAALEQEPERRREALELELARLDQLQSAHWASAISGDLDAAALVLKIISSRVRVLGLDQVLDRLDTASAPLKANSTVPVICDDALLVQPSGQINESRPFSVADARPSTPYVDHSIS